MLSRRDELEAFKRDINLSEYAAACGYVLDRRRSCRTSAVMVHPDGDKVVVARAHDGHWVFFSVRDERDHGTVVDFVQRRQGGSLGEVRKELRPWLSGRHSPAPPAALGADFVRLLDPVAKDMARVRAALEGMAAVEGGHRYLEEVRRIPRDALAHRRFEGRIRVDQRGNAVFPHWNVSGLCGYELKNRGFTGFAPGGEKGLWLSRSLPEDNELVVTESAIDALSHFALRRPLRAQYASVGGSLNPGQPELVRRAAGRLPEGSRVALATDNDQGGRRLARALSEALLPLRHRVRPVEQSPALPGADWNDALREQHPGMGR